MHHYMNQFKFDDLEDFFPDVKDTLGEHKVLVLIIYDVINDKRRTKLANFLLGYGFRVQKSAFEALLSVRTYKKLISEISKYVTKEDSLRLYKIIGKGQVLTWGKDDFVGNEDIIVV